LDKKRATKKKRGRLKLSKSVRISRQINPTIKRWGTARKLRETRLKNAEKGKDHGGRGASEEGDKNGEKSRKGRERERKVSFAKNNFFTSIDETFHAFAVLKRRVGVKERDETKRAAFFFPDWNVLPSHDGIYKLHRTNVQIQYDMY